MDNYIANLRDADGNQVPMIIELVPDTTLILSKVNAKTYLQTIKDRVKESGNIELLFKFVEVIKFFDKINEIIKGNSQAPNPEDREGDKEFKKMVMDEVFKYGKEGYKTARGAKFGIMENAGTVYHYENCNDPILASLVERSKELLEYIKDRQEFLKTVPKEGMKIVDESGAIPSGELIEVFPPYKTSTTTYKVTLPK